MKEILKWIGVLVIVLLGIQAASASVNVNKIIVNPSGDLKSGETAVDVSFLVDLVPSGGETFPMGDILQFATDLDNANWSYNLIINEIKQGEKSEIGNNFNIDGWDLSYKKNTVSVDVKLSGTAPAVTSSMNKTIFKVSELSKGSTTGTTIDSRVRMVINPVSTSQGISAVKATLADFRSLIDQKSSTGVNTNEANAKYDEASNAIRTAEQAPNYVIAQQYLQKAQDLINEGKPLLDKASTQKLIADAQVPIDQTDQLITYFKVNKSMKESDPKLVLIISKEDRSKDLLSDARDLVSQGKYTDANNKANEASAKANEALNDALALKKEIGDSGNLFGGVGAVFGSIAGAAMYIVIVIVAVVLVVVGVIFYKRRRRWDELG